MELLVWPTVKAQLYLIEAAHVKQAVGRERIRRNKDTLRELRCLQEILGDLHAGEFGHESERRAAADAAAISWDALCKTAAASGSSAETLCSVSQKVKRFLLSRHKPHKMPSVSCSSQAATSTREPTGSLPDLDARSSTVATDLRHDAALCSVTEGSCVRAGPGRRLSREQLDSLAVELREQLDQERTSLLASIEEVQGLMEAEVADAGLLPSRLELEAFSSDADEALRRLQKELNSEASQPIDPQPISSPLEQVSQVKNEQTILPPLEQVVAPPARQRWADMASDSEEGPANTPTSVRAALPHGCVATLQCCGCHEILPRKAFSRRAWRQGRRPSGPAPVACLRCDDRGHKTG